MHVFRRGSRASYYFTGRVRNGWKQLCTYTPDRRLAEKIAVMWRELSEEQRAWDVLDRIAPKQMTPADMYDLWRESGRDVHELRRRLNDTNLEPIVEEFLTVYANKVRADTVDHVRFHVRVLIPEGEPVHASKVTTEWLTKRLNEYEGKRNTIRKVHASWSVFFAYCTRVKRLFRSNPMDEVDRPPIEKPPIRFYERDVIDRIIGWQPSPARRALFALLYGGACEPSVAVGLGRADLNPSRKECRAPGTKAHTRDRVLRIDDWAWGFVWEHAKTLLPAARLFPLEWDRHQVHDWHSLALDDLEIEHRYPPYNARHAWAVRHLRAGAPIGMVQQQLGHASPQLTLSVYGQFIPSGIDRDHWQQKTAEYEERRKEAK